MAGWWPMADSARVICTLLCCGLALGAESSAGAAAEKGARGAVTNLPLPRFVSVRAEAANARRGPSLDQKVDWTFQRRGWPLQIVAEYGHWRRVRDVDGAEGWVHHSLLSGLRTVLVRSEGVTPIHAGVGTDTPVRAYVEPGVVAELDRCEAARCQITAGGFAGWIARDALWGVGQEDGPAE
jgi:SH3-like domain-containing protein